MAEFEPEIITSVDQPTSSVAQPDNTKDQPIFAQGAMTTTTWNPNSPSERIEQIVSFEDLNPWPHVNNHTQSPSSASSSSSSSSPPLKASPPMRKVKDDKVEKRKAQVSGKFVIMTPNSINAQAGRPNPFECFEAMRATHRGRKGPLANETKQSALQVRRLGACFCCRSRKVKCDEERPCKHCNRLMLHLPQVVCWQFQDFIPILFPEFIRSHFRKEEMVKFLRENVVEFCVGGIEQLCEVELFSGPRFSTVLGVKAKFFTAKTCDVLQHWHMNPALGQANLQSNCSAPIGVEFNTVAQRDDLRKRAKAYARDIINEPFYAEQVTDTLRSTQLPMKILRIVQTYAKQSDVSASILLGLQLPTSSRSTLLNPPQPSSSSAPYKTTEKMKCFCEF